MKIKLIIFSSLVNNDKRSTGMLFLFKKCDTTEKSSSNLHTGHHSYDNICHSSTGHRYEYYNNIITNSVHQDGNVVRVCDKYFTLQVVPHSKIKIVNVRLSFSSYAAGLLTSSKREIKFTESKPHKAFIDTLIYSTRLPLNSLCQQFVYQSSIFY